LSTKPKKAGIGARCPNCRDAPPEGESLDELERNILEAIGLCLAAQVEDKGPVAPERLRKWEIQYPPVAV